VVSRVPIFSRAIIECSLGLLSILTSNVDCVITIKKNYGTFLVNKLSRLEKNYFYKKATLPSQSRVNSEAYRGLGGNIYYFQYRPNYTGFYGGNNLHYILPISNSRKLF